MKPLPPLPADTPTLAELERGFAQLQADSDPRWGRMRPGQMVAHCRAFAELCLGRVPVALPLRLVARLLGPLLLRKMMSKSATQTPKNLTTLKSLRAEPADVPDLDVERGQLAEVFAEIATVSGTVRHPLYGAMRATDLQALVRHHTAHHANQFGVWRPASEA